MKMEKSVMFSVKKRAVKRPHLGPREVKTKQKRRQSVSVSFLAMAEELPAKRGKEKTDWMSFVFHYCS